MKTCRRWRKEFGGDPGEFAGRASTSPWKEHLAMCPDCRKEWEDAEKILQGAAALKEDVRAAMATVDWEALSEQIADAALSRRRMSPSPVRVRPLRPRAFVLKPLFAGALGGLLIGAAVMYFALRTPESGPAAGSAISASSEFIDRAELSATKRETIDYLDKSRALLLDFVQADPREAGRILQDESSARRTAGLLLKKRLMNARLDDAAMAKARNLCDQIERMFVELSLISEEISAEEAARIQRYIEEKNLLLRIKLLRGELAGSEV